MFAAASHSEIVTRLRASVADVRPRRAAAIPFAVPELDRRLADHGLDCAALHDIAPAAPSLSDDAAATLFIAGITARLAAAADTRVMWVVSRFDLYAPGLEQAGLPPDASSLPRDARTRTCWR